MWRIGPPQWILLNLVPIVSFYHPPLPCLQIESSQQAVRRRGDDARINAAWSCSGEARRRRRGSRLLAEPVDNGEPSGVSDDEIAKLLKRVAALRERDVLDDQECSRNWRHGNCKHDVLIEADTIIQQLQLHGDQLAFGTVDGGCYIVDLETKKLVNAFQGHDGELTALAFDGEWLLSGGADKTARVQRVERRSLRSTRNELTAADGSRESGGLGECLYTLRGHGERVVGVARVGRRRVASGSLDGKVRLWDVGSGDSGSGSSDSGASSGRSGGGSDGEILLPSVTYDAGSPVLCLGASDGYVAAGLMSGYVVVLDGSSGKPLLNFRAHAGAVRSLFFPGKEVLVTGGGDGVVAFWDLVEGGAPAGNKYQVDGRELTHRFVGHEAPIVAVACDLTKLVSASVDGVVRVWDMRRGIELFRIEGRSSKIRSVQFNRRLLITDGTAEAIISHDFSGDAAASGGQDEFAYRGE